MERNNQAAMWTNGTARLGPGPLILALCAMVSACTTATPAANVEFFVPPGREVRAQLKTIAVVSTPLERWQAGFDAPSAGSGAAKGARRVLEGGCGGGCLALPLVVMVGAIIGAAKEHPREQFDKAAKSIRDKLAELSPSADLRREVVATARDLTALEVIDGGETSDSISFAELADKGVDTVLELKFTRFILQKWNPYNPLANLVLEAKARLVHAADGAEIHGRTWKYIGSRRDYFQMASRDPDALRNEILSAYTLIAEKMVVDLFTDTKSELVLRAPPYMTVYTIDGPRK